MKLNSKNSISILIVDDSSSNIDILANILSEYKLLVANNGKRAIDIAIRLRPQIILLDVMMPGISGFEVCRQLKLDEGTKDIPVIFLTAQDGIDDEVKGLETGAVDFIQKPISPPILLARIKTQVKLLESQKIIIDKNNSLESTLIELKLAQSKLVQNEKLVSLGEIIAGVAHEVNTPLGAIKSINTNNALTLNLFISNLFHLQLILNNHQIAALNVFLKCLKSDFATLSTKEERSKREILLSELEANNCNEFLPFIDQLVELGIYNHNQFLNDLSSVKDLNSLIDTAMAYSKIFKSQEIISIATNKLQQIVMALKNYSRKNELGEKVTTKLSLGIDTVLVIYQYKMKNSVKIIKNYVSDEYINVYEDELIQVWTNLLTNSLQAMNNEGTIEITIEDIDNFVKVSFRDTGKGIPDEVKEKIFDPFFTTKPREEGTGIGLDIVKRIIEKHGGSISVESKIDFGTCFNILIPR
ncbi:MAG: hybrid sensor histidine kinase/response regulator [Ignavibacteriae bacterium HGW-Ignavibacteriae-4]|jgi:signal transduction histidine kinase|nr:MAG: hybrid sensor histidine kinase/response regulator [Ignavibacteriae bacterium HGW-Ignavibacteriae-4]